MRSKVKSKEYDTLKKYFGASKVREALTLTDTILSKNPYAAQLYVKRSQLIQVLDEESPPETLEDAEKALKTALYLDGGYFDALVDLMHLYDVVIPHRIRAVKLAKEVKQIAQKVLAEAQEILDEPERFHKGTT